MSHTTLQRLRQNITSVYMGNTNAVDRLLICLLARGHLLIEDVPGVGKTVLAGALARSLDGDFARIQCTPDLLPSDITGVTIYDQERQVFQFKPGPVFNNIVVADEINRTTPRTQSAMLEAMNEGTVSLDGTTHELPHPFMVIATQNPYEFEGTYTLPENQLDRFLMRFGLGYPAPSDEARIVLRQPARTTLRSLEPVMDIATILELQTRVDAVKIDTALVDYILQLAIATREHDDLLIGISPRGSIAMAQAARATAVLDDRDYCVPEDIVSNVLQVCAHRLISKSAMHDGDTSTTRRIMQQVLETIQSPA